MRTSGSKRSKQIANVIVDASLHTSRSPPRPEKTLETKWWGRRAQIYYSLRVQFPSETPKSPLRNISSTRNRPYLLKREIDSWCLEDRGNCSLLPLRFDDGGGFGFWIVLSISHRHSAFSLAWPTRLQLFRFVTFQIFTSSRALSRTRTFSEKFT